MGGGLSADAASSADALAQGAVLLGVVAVRRERGVRVAAAVAEAGGKRTRGRGRVWLRGVVYVFCWWWVSFFFLCGLRDLRRIRGRTEVRNFAYNVRLETYQGCVACRRSGSKECARLGPRPGGGLE